MNGNIKLRMKSAWQFNSANHTWWLCSPFSTDLTCFISLLVAVLTHPEYYISNIVPSVMTWHQPYQTIPCGKTLFNYIYSFCDNYRWGGGGGEMGKTSPSITKCCAHACHLPFGCTGLHCQFIKGMLYWCFQWLAFVRWQI